MLGHSSSRTKGEWMLSLVRKAKALGLVVVVAGAFAAVAASPAVAAPVAANFSSNTIKLTTTGVTIKRNGGEATTCTLSSPTTGGTEGNFAVVYNTEALPLPTVLFTCSGGKGFSMKFAAEAFHDTVPGYYLQLMDHGMEYNLGSPWGKYWHTYETNPAIGKWTNGSGLTPSNIKFENAPMGTLEAPASGSVTLSGTFIARTTSNTLLTLSK
jgi:hypothetical protein